MENKCDICENKIGAQEGHVIIHHCKEGIWQNEFEDEIYDMNVFGYNKNHDKCNLFKRRIND